MYKSLDIAIATPFWIADQMLTTGETIWDAIFWPRYKRHYDGV
jgi:hypothetical protein